MESCKPSSINIQEIDYSEIEHRIGRFLSRGSSGKVYHVNGIANRVFKVLSLGKFFRKEVIIAQKASECKVGPIIHNTFRVQCFDKIKIYIEMDYAGKSLEIHMKELAKSPRERDDEKKQAKELQKEINNKYITEIPFEECIERLYIKPEEFYHSLFSKIKTLNLNKISYYDLHEGNIIPNPNTDTRITDLMLIDFELCRLFSTVHEARQDSLMPPVMVILKNFADLPNLSNESIELLSWFVLEPYTTNASKL
jgi:hypothetical protein